MKPENADYFGWDSFKTYAEMEGISLEYEEDYLPWWNCWKSGYIRGLKDRDDQNRLY